MYDLDGRVYLVSGAARGQGRAHSIRLASEGAITIAFDLCDSFEHTLAPASSEQDLEETRVRVEEVGGTILTQRADARDLSAMEKLAGLAMERFGRIDGAVINHGLWAVARNSWELDEASWTESIDVLLSAPWKIAKAIIPSMISGGRGGSIVMTSSVNALVPQPGAAAYSAAKAGLVMLAKVLAYEVGPWNIRVNALAPGAVDTLMLGGGTREVAARNHPEFFGERPRTRLPEGMAQPADMANVVAWLLSDESAFVTGAILTADAGYTIG